MEQVRATQDDLLKLREEVTAATQQVTQTKAEKEEDRKAYRIEVERLNRYVQYAADNVE